MDSAQVKKFSKFSLGGILLFLSLNWVYTVVVVQLAINQGVYVTAEMGMVDRTLPYYVNVEKYETLYAGPNFFEGKQPHVWYVMARIWAKKTIDGHDVGSPGKNYDTPGHFFLHTKKGWVLISEGLFPVYLGFWMKAFGLAGPGSASPTTNHTNW